MSQSEDKKIKTSEDTKTEDQKDENSTQNDDGQNDENQEDADSKVKDDSDSPNFKKLKAKQKALEAKLAQYEEAEKKKKEEELKEKGKFDELLKEREKEIEKLKHESTKAKASKTIQNTLTKKNINPEALDLLESKALEIAEISDTGEVSNLDEVVDILSSSYSFLFTSDDKVKVVNAGASSSASNKSKITYEQWSQLSPEKKIEALDNGTYSF